MSASLRLRHRQREAVVSDLPVGDISRLLDHLVGAGAQRERHVEAERFRGFQVNHQLIRLPTVIRASCTSVRFL